MVHMKLLKNKEHLSDIESILDEADIVRNIGKN